MADVNDRNLVATVMNVQKFTVHDGPGIRTEIFFKGCPLKCLWCSNPEGIRNNPEVGVYGRRDCIGIDKCGWCINACPLSKENVLTVEDNKVVAIDREKCLNCLSCAKACPNDSLKIFGRQVTVPELMKVIMEDRSFYQKSGGGVTLSGGDPLVQWEFVVALLKECKRASIHTCVESELHCKTEVLDQVLPYTDLLMTDIKHMDSAKHRKYTGVSNKLILSNIGYAAIKGTPMIIRFPVVPGYNDDDENIKATAEFIIKYVGGCLRQVQLLPYRPLGVEKYEALGMEYTMKGSELTEPDSYLSRVRGLAEVFQSYGIPAAAGTTVKTK
ncbi:4-hydroxyphenylacetate decarboxylase activating enzyme [Pelotomaculum schinkii]|uniref:4-hydroxyphenylacetate decarboxylase activating enzyme n=1 Tax=Pelotomaculum schinkii TaxID=78350 RepID=A0A4Y7R8Z0_9FIRM|nr:glycyl-radical enzyme activating protein [Pelotomaculum schinkii]TEB05425.1 4-hydroxyphenylacetate decarboxylase activating enzyme [Pelotomaculum schinkii]